MTLESGNRHAANTAFFFSVGACLGLPGELVQRLGGGETILGPAGMLCRVHTQMQQGEVAAFPEVILPLAARELGGDEVVTLLALQEQLLTEYGWRLTLSDLGLLCVCPLLLERTPDAVATALERGQVVARVVLDALVTQAGSAAEVAS
ncbi:Hpa3 family type III secretion system protein [Xanthomonas arboricola]|uniref:Hpa3 family type III secretion system protein n=2 Tax=Xanthomonas arboricola pv. pruni TaxID=69929 RepID=A0AAP4NGB4_9XANT|nr:Hpa3 family type III secretion system protein [Xanthomonas arboricola]MDN0266032.1 Hpa3 family type III secretion system protein [Xanthomonas arboricola pv. pruni]MDN0270056.1 Hpa3 family type III secretion system protein [Xanthomonas arboricola pv. pruni]MDN0274357.1 Hpa3 family type III secretion system protein [Xanthomonas arboricola pv. pruni]MDN0282771.1 Hpa3 family type III secretion system protein [Xanthomonas arboricola pv. pruni]MDN0286710.1 Hpa3 family type III secretion system pr